MMMVTHEEKMKGTMNKKNIICISFETDQNLKCFCFPAVDW